MADEHKDLPPDDWLALTEDQRGQWQRRVAECELAKAPVVADEHEVAIGAGATRMKVGQAPRQAPLASPLDDVHTLAQALPPEDRLKLAARLWTSLLPRHRAALIHFQLDDTPSQAISRGAPPKPFGQSVRRFLFERENTSELYSAPRRFDLATIFVVTAAFSIILGGMAALDFGPLAKVVVGGLIALVAVGQAFFHDQANPRGVSVIIGVVAYALFSLAVWPTHGRPASLFLVVVINGVLLGALFGYCAGVLVGGMFLCADALRGKFSPAKTSDESAPATE